MDDFSKQIIIDGVITNYMIYYYSGKVLSNNEY